MARSASVIQKQILDYARVNYGTNLTDLFYSVFFDGGGNPIPPSTTNKFVLFSFIVATAINIFEQLLDLFKTEIETDVSLAPPGTNLWLQNQISLFQYSATTPQVIQVDLTNFAISYPVVNPALRIITQRAVVNTPTGGYTVKVASSLAPVNTQQLNALTSFLNQINFGVPYTVINADPDFLMLGANIYYDGQYSSTIVQSVTDAINAYINDFDTNNFNGIIFLSRLEDIIQSVTGVTDVVLTQIEARPNTIAPANATQLVNNSQVLLREYSTYAGYIIIDTVVGRRLIDTLTFIIA